MNSINEKVFAKARENWGGDSLDCFSRAPERRVFCVDAEDLPETEAEQYFRDLKAKYDSTTGTISEDCVPVSDAKKLFTTIEGLQEQIDSLKSEVGQIFVALKRDHQGNEIELVRMTVTKEDAVAQS